MRPLLWLRLLFELLVDLARGQAVSGPDSPFDVAYPYLLGLVAGFVFALACCGGALL